MERAPGFIGTAGVPLVRQVNISYSAEFTPTVSFWFALLHQKRNKTVGVISQTAFGLKLMSHNTPHKFSAQKKEGVHFPSSELRTP